MNKKEYSQRWRDKNPEHDKEYCKTEKGQERIKRARKKKRERFLEIKRQYVCEVCGERDPVVLEFHHIDPTIKEANVATASGWSLERLKKEIAKCCALCANCHRKLHFYGEEKWHTIY